MAGASGAPAAKKEGLTSGAGLTVIGLLLVLGVTLVVAGSLRLDFDAVEIRDVVSNRVEPSQSPAPFAAPRRGAATIFTSDNRVLMDTYKQIRDDGHGYFSTSAVLNYLYAKRWGYKFVFYHISLNMSEFPPDEYNASSPDRAFLNDPYQLNRYPKLRAGCAHMGQKELRQSPWCKVLACYLQSGLPRTNSGAAADDANEFALYMDSDAIVMDHNVSISEYVERVAAERGHEVTWGPTPLANATVAFLSNKGPWAGNADKFPVSGFFWFRPGAGARRFFEYWWDVRDPLHSFYHGFEQESLWLWMRNFKHMMSIVNVASLVEAPGQWARHFGTNDPYNRIEPMIRKLASLGVDEARFTELIHEIQARHVVELDSVAVARALEAGIAAAGRPSPSFVFPVIEGRRHACEQKEMLDCSQNPP